MRSAIGDVLPPSVRRSLRKLGSDLNVGRRKRGLTVAMMAERLAVAQTTYLRAEKGDPKVAVGIYAMALFVLGFGVELGSIADPGRDEQGLLLDRARLPKRVRVRREPTLK